MANGPPAALGLAVSVKPADAGKKGEMGALVSCFCLCIDLCPYKTRGVSS